MSQLSYSTRLRRATLLAFLVPIALALPLSFVLRHITPGDHFWLVLAAALLVAGTTLAACIPWWHRLDDMQRHGHMISWYWGGIAGALAMLAWLFAAVGLNSDQAKGAVALLLAQGIGFMVFWAAWMWRRRDDTR